MRGFSFIYMILLGLGAGTAQAQTSPIRWDVSASAALAVASPGLDRQAGNNSGDDWYGEGRYAATIGRYWTEHLKTEVEYATTGEGSTYQFIYPTSVESMHRIGQLSARMVWQFGENKWVHPYVSGGIVAERDAHRLRIPAQYQYPPGHTTGPMLLIPKSTSAPAIEHRVGVTAGAGAKIYMTQNAFFNAGFVATYAKPSTTLGFLAGFGIDF